MLLSGFGVSVKVIGLVCSCLKSHRITVSHVSDMKEKANKMFKSEMHDCRLVVASREKDDCDYQFNHRKFTKDEVWLDFDLVEVTRFGLVILAKYNKNENGIETDSKRLFIGFNDIRAITDSILGYEVVVDLLPWESLLGKFDKYAFDDDIVIENA